MGHDHYMDMALDEARRAREKGEIPVGAIIVQAANVIAKGHNRAIELNDPTAHAEIVVLREACSKIGNYRLPRTTLYVTIEPCLMCVGAIVQARIEQLVFGAAEPKSGAVISQLNAIELRFHNHQVSVTSGVRGEECGKLMQDFFAERR